MHPADLKASIPPERLPICMVVYSYYPADPRVRREAEALQATGKQVDVICLKGVSENKEEVVSGVRVYRLPVTRSRAGKLKYLWEYASFILAAFSRLNILHCRNRYKIVHVHNMPDILVFSAILPKLTGTRIILDLHDPMPEVFMAKYAVDRTHGLIRVLSFLEQTSIKFSDFVLTPNKAFYELFIARGCPAEKIQIIMNSPQEDVFAAQGVSRKTRKRSGKQFVLMYHGTIVERNGLDTALRAAALISPQVPGLKFHVYGEGDYLGRFLDLVRELQLEKIIEYHGHVPLEQIAEAIRSIDVGIIPNKSNPFNNINFPTRIFEYLSMGKMVIAPRTRGIADYFAAEALNFFEPGNVEDLARVIMDIYSHPEEQKEKLHKGMMVYKAHRWALEKGKLISIVDTLL